MERWKCGKGIAPSFYDNIVTISLCYLESCRIRDVTSDSRGYIGAMVVQFAGSVTDNTEGAKEHHLGLLLS